MSAITDAAVLYFSLLASVGFAANAKVESATSAVQPLLSPSQYASYFRKPLMPIPPSNPLTPEKIDLGARLFFDKRLSGDNKMSCASCHMPEKDFSDGRERAVGKNDHVLRRRVPTLLNAGYEELLFWDGRAANLEEQALVPMTAHDEMDQNTVQLIAELTVDKDYPQLFAKAFPDKKLSIRTITMALACYERTLNSAESPFDKWIQGEASALSKTAEQGFQLFIGRGRCLSCHAGWRFSNGNFHDTGLKSDDPGRFAIDPRAAFKNAFKTPTLRNVAKRGPYMHNGSLKTLADVIDFYNRGGDEKRPGLSKLITPLALTAAEKAQLLEFLKAL